MPLKAVVDTLDGIEEHFHSLYTQRNGKFEITGIEGMRTQGDVDRLTASLDKERTDHKAVKTRYAAFANLDLAEIQAKLDKYPELETLAAGKLDESKIDGIVQSRIKGITGPIERERDLLRTGITERDAMIQSFQARETQRNISDKIREAATASKLLPEAFEDALLLAERVFEVTEDGRVVTKDNVGVTPGIDASVWFTEMQAKRPHWWGPSVGGGAPGSRTPGGQVNPWSHENWNLTEQGKIVLASPTRADQLAKSAGTTVGGKKPPARK